MATPWRKESWSKGILLGLRPDPNSGYRATVWFEYTRNLFNEIREGSLIAVRNFSDRARRLDGSPAGERRASYEEYSILQIDQMHPWHYAIQGGGDQGYPGFTVAAAESAREDWTDMDSENRDDVSRIKCEAIPLRLAFRVERREESLPEAFFDRSMPMPGFEARLLSAKMMEAVINRDIDEEIAFELGNHIVQFDVPIKMQRSELTRLHFGVFGYTGAGKSNLVSTLVDDLLSSGRQSRDRGNRAYKVVVTDLMDEYTGLLIDHLVRHNYSGIVVCGRRTVAEQVLDACIAVADAENGADRREAEALATRAAQDWSRRLILPAELKSVSDQYAQVLKQLIMAKKIKFYEPWHQQGRDFDIDLQELDHAIGPQAYQTHQSDRDQRVRSLVEDLEPVVEDARQAEGGARDRHLRQIIQRIEDELQDIRAQNTRRRVTSFRDDVQEHMGSRGALPFNVSMSPRYLAEGLLNFQPTEPHHYYDPSLTLVIGENEEQIARFVGQLVENCFEVRRTRSILYPTISFVFDEADVFISQSSRQNPESNMIEHATMLARRGRKFGLGIGIATQRVRYLDTSIMAQPHTYFISKLPRKSDREGVAEAFAISDETLEQTFAFTVGQWLVTSHDATGLKGIPFPVQLPNANDRVRSWLDANSNRRGS